MRDFAPASGGDKRMLRADELDILENQILPTARRWLRVHGLRSPAIQTLTYWGETVPEEFRK